MSQKLRNNLTVVITFHEGHKYLKRLIDFHLKSHFNFLILDSNFSEPKNINLPSNFKYIHCPGTGIGEKILNAYKSIDTEFVVWNSHDDFLVEKGLKSAINFLESNLDYASVHGKTFVKYKNYLVYESPRTSIDEDDVISRLRHLYRIGYDNNLFAVNRTKNMVKIYTQIMHRFLSPCYEFEFRHVLGNLAFGKIKVINDLYLVREKPPGSAGEIHKNTLLNLDLSTNELVEFISQNSNQENYKISSEVNKYLSAYRERKKKQLEKSSFNVRKLIPSFIKESIKKIFAFTSLSVIKKSGLVTQSEFLSLKRICTIIDNPK